MNAIHASILLLLLILGSSSLLGTTSCCVQNCLQIGVETLAGRYQNRHPFRDFLGKGGETKLRWEDLYIPTLSCQGRWIWRKQWYLESQGKLGSVVHATFRDADYWYHDENLVRDRFCLTRHQAGDGEYALLNLGMGRAFFFPSSLGWIAPMIGAAYRQSSFTMTGGHFAECVNPVMFFTSHPFTSLSSYQRARYYSLWVGMEGETTCFSRFLVRAKVEGHLTIVYTTKFWNLRDFHRNALSAGFGSVVECALLLPCSAQRKVGCKISYESWFSGQPRIHYTFPSPATSSESTERETICVAAPPSRTIFETVSFALLIEKQF